MSDQTSHSLSEPEAKAGFPFLAAFGLFLLLILVSVGGLMLGHSGSPTEEEDAARAAVRTKNLADLQATDTAQLTTYGWSDRAKGIVHIPIDRAMQLVIPSLNLVPAPTPTTSAAPESDVPKVTTAPSAPMAASAPTTPQQP